MGITITSTTSPQAELDHAASEEWREPFEPKEETPKQEELELKPAETASEPETTEAEVAKPKGHKGGGSQKRIDKLTARNFFLENRLAELEAKVKPAEETKTEPQVSREPKLADYGNNLEEFLKARDAWKENSEKQSAELERRKATVDSYNEKVSKARAEYDDWDEVVAGSKITVPQAAIDAAVDLDNGPDVAYYLATHPEEAEKLMDLSAIRVVHAVGKISDKLAAERVAPPPKPKVKPPEPLAPVGASATRSGLSLDELSPREYIRIRNKQERENRRL